MDADGRGSESAPFASLQYAADGAQPGDTIHVRNGGYPGFYIEHGGTEAAPIRFVGEGDMVHITAPNSMTDRDGINIENADHVVVENFVADDMPRAGVRCALSRFVTIRRVRADANGTWGIFSGCCPDLTVEDNLTTNSVEEHGIYVSNSADRPVIRRNVSYGNRANGIHMNGDASIECDREGFDSDGVIAEALVESNVIYDNGSGGGSGINCDGVQSSIIRNNLIYDAHASGISLYMIDAAQPARDNQILHNTIVIADDGRWALNIQGGSTGTRVRNNVFVTNHSFRGSIVATDDSLTGLDSDYNLLTPRLSPDGDATILDLTEWQALGYDEHSVMAEIDAIFANPGVDDYHLKDGSPAIDRGEAGVAELDLEGGARPAGAAPDLGAFERGAMAPVDAGMDDAGLPQPMDAAREASVRDASGDRFGDEYGIGEDEDDGGCDCRAARSARGGITWLLAALALLFVRRRRR